MPIATVEVPRIAVHAPLVGFPEQHAAVPALVVTTERDLLYAALNVLHRASSPMPEPPSHAGG